MKKMTPKQIAFAVEFVANGGNASAAYRVAYNTARMKAATIKKRASELMGNGDIRGTINKMLDEEVARLKKRYQVDNDRAMEEYSCIAFSDIRKLFDKNGNLLPIDQIDPDTARAIASIEVVENTRGRGEDTVVYYTHKIKMLDKLGALRDVAKMLGMFKEGVPDDKPPVTVNNQINVPEALGRLYPSPAVLPGECDKDKWSANRAGLRDSPSRLMFNNPSQAVGYLDDERNTIIANEGNRGNPKTAVIKLGN